MPIGQLPGLSVPDIWLDTGTPGFGTALLIDAAGEKAAMVGRVHIPGGGAKNISTVGFRFGTCTVIALETLTLSLQDVDLTTGFPDETQDQSVTIPNGSIVTGTWLEVTLGATRTVNPGDVLAVVWEYLNFVALASVVINTIGGQVANQICYPALKSGGGPTWATISAAASVIPNVVLGFSDGTYGTLLGAGGWSNMGTNTYNNGSATKEIGTRFISAFPGIIEGFSLFVDLDGDTTVNLYEAAPDLTGETLKTSLALDKDVRNQSTQRLLWAPFPVETIVKPGWAYYLGVQPTSATSIVLGGLTVNTAGYLAAFSGGTECQLVSRATAGTGAWTVTNSQRAMIGPRFRGVQYPVRSAGMASTG